MSSTLKKLPFEQTNAFTPFFLDFIAQKEGLKKFYNRFPEKDSFAQQIEEKKNNFHSHNRAVLVQALQQQYQGITITGAVDNSLKQLADPKTFTITTGHQLNIFTGPLYFIYKIVTVINACKQLKAQYPNYNFVPVYWMASEDHDYDEIKSFRLYGKKYIWETKQQGAVGRFHTNDFKQLLAEVPGAIELFKKAYTLHETLAEAVRYYVNELFGDEGLVVVDGDSVELKSLFKSVIKDDIFNHTAKAKVDKTNEELESLGYKPQIYCREINFFYLDKGLRSRIEQKGDTYEVLDTDLKFSRQEIEKLIESNPEKFSPNVILRPLYEEIILPNIAYCGGPAEIVYWLQLKDVFHHFNTSFPILLPRTFGLVIDEPTQRKIEKSGLNLEELFLEKNYLYNHIVLKLSREKVLLNGQKELIEKQFEVIKSQATVIDQSLNAMIAAETRRMQKSLEKIEQKFLKAEKRKQSDKLGQVEAIKNSLFPNGSLQERTDNFLNFYQQHPDFIKQLLNNFNPFDLKFNILYL